MRLDELKKIKSIDESKTERIIRDELRDSLPGLPYNHVEQWTDNLRKAVFELIDLLLKEFKTCNENLREKNMDMLCIIVHRADKETLEKIKHDFLDILERLYDDPKVEKSSDLIKLLQALHSYEPDYIKKMIDDAIEHWSTNVFENRYRDIEIDRYVWKDVNRLRELRLYILESLASARKKQDMIKVERLEKLYNIIRSR